MVAKPIAFNKKNREGKNTQGLRHLYWEIFDCPMQPGSAFKYMEREPVYILEDIFAQYPHWTPTIEIAYTSQSYANLLGLPQSSSHRVGKAIQILAKSPERRMFIVKHLILRGVTRIGIGINHVYFDTDNYLKKDALYVQ
jgi:hypothetical protein